jgi:hypothetical protein
MGKNNVLPAEQLPEEIKEQIKKESVEEYPSLDIQDTASKHNRIVQLRVGYIAGATAWVQWKQRYDELKAQETTDVFVPCLEDDPRCAGGYTSTDGQSLCYVRESKVPVIQSGAVWVKASDRLPEKGGRGNIVIVRGVFKENGYSDCPFVAHGYRNFNPVKQEMYFELGSKSYLTNDVEWLDESGATDLQATNEELRKLVSHYKEVAKIENELYRERCYEYSALKVKADKMEAVLMSIAMGNVNPQSAAYEALAWKGEVDGE